MDKLKQSLYFPQEMLEEIKSEAKRLERSRSWVVQKAWKIAKGHIHDISADPDLPAEVTYESSGVPKGER